jgi:hypothetical protein
MVASRQGRGREGSRTAGNRLYAEACQAIEEFHDTAGLGRCDGGRKRSRAIHEGNVDGLAVGLGGFSVGRQNDCARRPGGDELRDRRRRAAGVSGIAADALPVYLASPL